MKVKATEFEDVKIIELMHAADMRGAFTKIFNEDEFAAMGLCTDFRETYYSVSQKDVIRGMHFQLPPYEHTKLVHVIAGSVVDVVVDLRKNSPDYKKCLSFSLSAQNPAALYIPKGFAHGFKSLEDNTMMLYQVTSSYQSQSDTGVAYNSIGYDWKVENPILSERDLHFVRLDEFASPF